MIVRQEQRVKHFKIKNKSNLCDGAGTGHSKVSFLLALEFIIDLPVLKVLFHGHALYHLLLKKKKKINKMKEMS